MENLWTTNTTADGLVDDIVLAIAVGPDEALWFGTCNGVSRFDGKEWKICRRTDGLAGDQVRSIEVAPDGALWFGTSSGGVS